MKHYPLLTIDHEALRSNMETVIGWCDKAGIDVAGVIKGSTGMASVALDYESCGAKWIASSMLEQLKRAREAGDRPVCGSGKGERHSALREKTERLCAV